MPEQDRDRSVEHVLRRVLTHDVPASPQTACVDGETMAAWTSGVLSTSEASIVEHHVAGCARCRAMMASFLQTTPAEPVAESFWRRWHLSWAVPLATAATAAALWVAIPDNGATPIPLARDANEALRGERSAAAPAALPSPAPKAEPESQVAAPLEKALARSDVRERNEDASAFRAAPAAPPATAPPALRSQEAVAPQAGAASQARASEADNRAFDRARPLAQAAALQRAATVVEIISPDGSARWRIVGGQVERSTSTSTEWTATSLASLVLTAGSSPSASVCWIVGPSGAVYLTTDGTRFMRVPFPEMADLVSVTATDDRAATVSSADGRSWRTADQGRTWTTAQ